MRAESKFPSLTRMAYTAPARTCAAVSQPRRSMTCTGGVARSSAREAARVIWLLTSKAWLYRWPNCSRTALAASSAALRKEVSVSRIMRLTIWVRAAPLKNAVAPPWVRATASAPSRFSSSWDMRTSLRNIPTARAVVMPVAEEAVFSGSVRVPRVGFDRVSSIRVSMHRWRHSSGWFMSQQ